MHLREGRFPERDRLRAIVASTGIGAWEWDLASGRLQWCDESTRWFGSATGTDPTSLDDLVESVDTGDRATFLRHVEEVVAEGGEREFECRTVTPGSDGRECWLRCRVQLLDDPEADRSVFGTALDITARKNL